MRASDGYYRGYADCARRLQREIEKLERMEFGKVDLIEAADAVALAIAAEEEAVRHRREGLRLIRGGVNREGGGE